ncbi:MAG: hypothetical protein H0U49_04895 [Parachlamydiaceae bacterium]|nr:hypothetical protein [Parachlamydiaceae bacterium]
MSKLFLILCLFISTSLVTSQPLQIQELIDIQLEISYLAAKRNTLISDIKYAHLTEINDQVKTIQTMRDYQWSKFISELNEAEKYENLAKADRSKLQAIDQRILQLNAEAAALLSPYPSRS